MRFFCTIGCIVVSSIGLAATNVVHANLEPMLDPEVIVPNDATIRLFQNAKLNPHLCRIFEESPYQNHLAMRYNREQTWYRLEPQKDVYKFNEMYGPLFKKALAEKSRVQIGFVYTCGGGLRGWLTHGYMEEGHLCVLPKWLYDELKASDHPMVYDEAFGGGWTPDYESPLLIERFRKLALAFAEWLKGNVEGTNVRRLDLLNGIEMRYFGYWGEGLIRREGKVRYPADPVYDRFIDVYLEAFPTTLLISSHQQSYHCTCSDSTLKKDPRALRASTHMGRIYSATNGFGRFGFFTDCWTPGNFNEYQPQRLLIPGEPKPWKAGEYRLKHVWGETYQTGEFAYFITTTNNNGRVAYDNLEADFRRNHQSSLSVHNFTIINRTHGKIDPKADAKRLRGFDEPTEEIYSFGRKALAMAGYRFVLGSPSVVKTDHGTRVSFTLENVGASKMFHDHYRLEVFVENADGKIIHRQPVSFDLRTLGYQETPLKYDPTKATKAEVTIPGDLSGTVRLIGLDRQGICHPLCFSNWGRRAKDGSYLLGELVSSARKEFAYPGPRTPRTAPSER